MECKNCSHGLKKVTFIKKGRVMWEWRHSKGGQLCKQVVGGKNLPFGKSCYCSNAEPKEKQRGKKK